MDQATYIKERVDGQINWFSNKSSKSKKNYITFRVIVIVLSVSIPFATGYVDEENIGKYIALAIGAAGVLIAALEGIESLLKYQENWVQYRVAAEALQREKMLFHTKAGNYSSSTAPFRDFVVRVEQILGDENNRWQEYQTNKGEDGGEAQA
ncbi:MAG: DUF4231 domain-containing protein [Bacteroidota bacterium]